MGLCAKHRRICPGGARPPRDATVALINAHRETYEVEPICAQLPIAPSTYYVARGRERDPIAAVGARAAMPFDAIPHLLAHGDARPNARRLARLSVRPDRASRVGCRRQARGLITHGQCPHSPRPAVAARRCRRDARGPGDPVSPGGVECNARGALPQKPDVRPSLRSSVPLYPPLSARVRLNDKYLVSREGNQFTRDRAPVSRRASAHHD